MRKWLMPWALLILVGCQPPPPTVFAMLEQSGLTFHVRERGLIIGRIFGWDDAKVDVRRLTILFGNRVLIRFERAEQINSSCRSKHSFPVQIGEQRCGYRWFGNAADLKHGESYDVRLESQDCIEEFCRDHGEWWSGEVVGRFFVNASGRPVNIRLR